MTSIIAIFILLIYHNSRGLSIFFIQRDPELSFYIYNDLIKLIVVTMLQLSAPTASCLTTNTNLSASV